MAHGHGEHGNAKAKAFALGIGLNLLFVAIEIIYGLLAHSSALLADAGHNASDVLSLGFAWTASWLATLKPKGKYTYGLRKTTILVSILNALVLFIAVAFITWDAIGKLQNPEPVAGKQVIIVAGIGVVVNTLTALLFIKGQKNDLNIRGAFLHMAADAGVSFGVLASGILIRMTGKYWIDPVTSFIIITVILIGTWRLFTEAIDLALDAVPKHINFENVRQYLLNKNNVEEIHDLHIWAISTTQIALTAHLVMPNGCSDGFIKKLEEELSTKFGIAHTTFQIENQKMKEDCRTGC